MKLSAIVSRLFGGPEHLSTEQLEKLRTEAEDRGDSKAAYRYDTTLAERRWREDYRRPEPEAMS